MKKNTRKKQPVRGGARPGAGRKKTLPDGWIRTTVALPADLVDWLDSQEGNRSEVIRSILIAAR